MDDQELRNRSNCRCVISANQKQKGSMLRRLLGFVVPTVLLSAYATMKPPAVQSSPVKQRSSCPEPGTVVPLKKVMNPAFIRDYQDCDIIVEATFLKTGNEGYILGEYNTSANATFQVLELGGTAQAGLGGMSFGTFAGAPKAKSDVLFELKKGDMIQLRGAPIGYFYGDNLVVGVFRATSVNRK